jgi:hypothetical protein
VKYDPNPNQGKANPNQGRANPTTKKETEEIAHGEMTTIATVI